MTTDTKDSINESQEKTQPGEAKFKKATGDTFANLASGLGGSNDRSQYAVFNPQFTYHSRMNYGYMYRDDWICRRVIDTPIDDATSKGRIIKSVHAEEYTDLESEYDLMGVAAEAQRWADLYGGAGILVLTGQPLSEPLDLRRVKKGTQIKFLVFDNVDLVPFYSQIWDPLAADYMQPSHYLITSGSARIHPSHIIKVIGRKMPRRETIQLNGWGVSELHACMKEFVAIAEAKGGLTQMMSEANVDVFFAKKLWDKLATDEYANVIARYQHMNSIKSNFNALVMDKEIEGYERKSLELNGAAAMMETFMTWVSGAAQMPITKIFGTSAKGMNATGEGDLTNYYDRLHQIQRNKLAPILKQLDMFVCLAHFGQMPKDFDYQWNPLMQPDELQKAQSEKLQTDKSLALHAEGIITKGQIARNLQQREEFQFTDEELEALDKQDKIDLDALDKPLDDETPARELDSDNPPAKQSKSDNSDEDNSDQKSKPDA